MTAPETKQEKKEGPTPAQRMNLALKIMERQFINLAKLGRAHEKPTTAQVEEARAWVNALVAKTFVGIHEDLKRAAGVREAVAGIVSEA